MKKCTVFLAIALVLGLSGIVSAASVDISGGYLFGNFNMNDELKCDANGFVLTGEMPVSGPFGAKVSFASITGDLNVGIIAAAESESPEMSATRFDILATYDLPVSLPEGASLKAIGGYSMTTTDLSAPFDVETKTKGFLIGAEGKFPVTDKLTVSGMFGLGLGMKAEIEGVGDEDANLTVFQVSADYEISNGISAEAGYISNKLTEDSAYLDSTTDGFYLGARASF